MTVTPRPIGIADRNFWRFDRTETGILAAGRWLWFRTIAWMTGLFAAALFVMFASLQLGDWLGLPEESSYYVAVLTPIAGLGLYSIAVKTAERRAPSELALREAPVHLLFGVAVGFSFMALSLGVLWLCGLNGVAKGHWQDWQHYFVFDSYISAVVEELAFRAILLRLLARLMGPGWGLILSATLFALAHASHAPPVALGLLVVEGGLMLGVVYMMTNSLWTSIGAHLAYDFTETSLFGIGNGDGFLVVTPSPQYPAWLTGGSFGPDGSVISAMVAIALIFGVVSASQRVVGRGAPKPRMDHQS